MEKLRIFVLAVLFLLSLAGCGNRQAKGISAYIAREDGEQYLILPVSGDKVQLREDHSVYLDEIDPEILKAAEKAILTNISEDTDKSGFYLQEDGGNLFLCLEVIEPIDPPETMAREDGTRVTTGCGIDHEHVFFSEQITR